MDQPVSCCTLTRMERNLYIMKGFLFRPMRSCLKMIGPGLDSLTPMAVTSMMGLVRIIRIRLPRISSPRLTASLSRLSKGVCRTLMSLHSSSTSMVGRAGR